MERDEVHEVAQGRVWTGTQALERGLVDELGGLETALAKAAELSGAGEYGILRLPRQKDFFELLMEDLEGGDSPSVELAIPGLELEVLQDLDELDRVLQDGAAAMLPGRLVIR